MSHDDVRELRSLLAATRAWLEVHASAGSLGLPRVPPAAWPPRVDDLLPAGLALATPQPAAAPPPVALPIAPPPVAPPVEPLTPEPPFGITALPPAVEPPPAAAFSQEPPAVEPLPPQAVAAPTLAVEPPPAAVVPPTAPVEPPPAEPVLAAAEPVPASAPSVPTAAPSSREEAPAARASAPTADPASASVPLFEDEPMQAPLFVGDDVPEAPRRPRPVRGGAADAPLPRTEAAHQHLTVLAQQISTCTLCPLHASRTQTVFARGNPDADLCFIGEAPGADEDASGQPFVGRAGELLDRMIAAMGLGPDEVYITNICRCRPPSNRTPTMEEMVACMPYLHEQMSLTQPRVIVALGATATKGLLGSGLGIRALRGTWKLYRGVIPVMPTFHPAYLLRETEAGRLDAKREVWKDLQAVLERLGRPLPQRGKK